MKKIIAAGVIFVIALFLGFQLFAAEPRSEVSTLQNRVDALEAGQGQGSSGSKIAVPKKPSQAQLEAALQKAIRSSGIVADEINNIAGRTEVVTESDPILVARFAEEVSRGPLFAVSVSGDLLPLSVVTVVPKYTLYG